MPTTILVSTTDLTLDEGAQATVTATVKDQAGKVMADASPSWTSSDAAVATVSGGGVISAVAPGKATVSAMDGSASAQVSVTVNAVATTVTYVSGSGQSGAVSTALRDSLAVQVQDKRGDGIEGVTVSFVVTAGDGTVSPTSVASDSSGYARAEWVLGDTAGANTVEARAEGLDGSPVAFQAQAESDSTANAVADLAISPDSTRLTFVGDTAYLTAVARNASGNPVSVGIEWSSLDSSVVTVSDSGVVTAEAEGATRVVATAGAVSDTSIVVVEREVASVSVTPATSTLTAGDTVQLTARALDSDGLEILGRSFTWSSSDAGVAAVDGDGLVTAMGSGTAQVSATTAGKSDTVDITVAVVEPTTFALGDTVYGAVAPAGDADTLTFSGTAGQDVVAYLQPASGAQHLTLTLYEQFGTPAQATVGSVGAYSDTTLYDTDNSGRLTLPSTGTYTAIVTGSYAGAVGNYRFVVFPVDCAPESVGTAIAVGDTVSGESIAPYGDVDVFTFSGTAGQEVLGFFQPLSQSDDLVFEIYDQYGTAGQNRLGRVAAYSTTELASENTGTISLPRTGTYTAVVRGNASRSDAGSYRFQIFPVNRAPETIPAAIAVGDTVTGEAIDPYGDVDEFTFDGTADDEVNVFLQPYGQADYMKLSLYAGYGTASESLIASTSASATNELEQYATGRVALPVTGTYTVVVQGYYDGQSRGTYQLQVFPVQRAPESVAAVVPLGDTITGEAIAPKGDIDTFTFAGAAGQDVDVFFQPLSGSGSLTLAVYDQYGTTSQQRLGVVSADGGSDLEAYTTGRFTLPRDSDYTIVVSGYWDDSEGAYQFQAFPVNPAPEVVSAQVALGDTTDIEAIDPKGDVDTFTFTATAGDSVDIFFQPLSGSDELKLSIYEQYGTTSQQRLDYVSAGGGSDLQAYSTGYVRLAAGGTYTIVVEGYYDDYVGSYRFHLRR